MPGAAGFRKVCMQRIGAVPRCKEDTMAVDLTMVGKQLDATQFTYEERDVMLYALGVGAGTDELPFTY